MENELNVTKRLFILLNLLNDDCVFYPTEIADILAVDLDTAEKEIEFFAPYFVKKVNKEGDVPAYTVLKRH